MYNSQLNDPLYSAQYGGDPGWNKWQVVAHWSRSGQSTVYTIVLHYMFNDRTRQAAQMKFKNSTSQGCGVA
jgi:hypothetical protein